MEESLAEVKSIQSDMAFLSLVETNKFGENMKSSDDDFEKSKCTRNMFSDCKFEIPDDFLIERIIQQVEYLLSDANILKDKFLLKHMRRNKEGYVSLKLISSLRKVKALSKDWRVVAYSLQKSRKLKMNEEMTKIRRVDPLPLFEELDSSRTVLVFHHPPGFWTTENVKKHLKKLGNVTTTFTVNSVADVMNINVQKTLESYKDIATFPFTVVRFETPDEAANAVLQTSHQASAFRICPLLNEENAVIKNSAISCPHKNNGEFPWQRDFTYAFAEKISPISVNSYLDHYYLKAYSEHISPSSSKIKTFKQDDKCTKPKSFRQLEKDALNSSHDREMFTSSGYRGDGPANNGWAHRRYFIGQNKESKVIILRQPKGPDGTKGFRRHRLSLSSLF